MSETKRKAGRPTKRPGINRVRVGTTVDPMTYKIIETYTDAHKISLGELIDAMAIRIAQGEQWPSRLE